LFRRIEACSLLLVMVIGTLNYFIIAVREWLAVTA
jgi:hypothetical protein